MPESRGSRRRQVVGDEQVTQRQEVEDCEAPARVLQAEGTDLQPPHVGEDPQAESEALDPASRQATPGSRTTIDPRAVAQLEAEQDPVIYRRSFKHAAVTSREYVTLGKVQEFDRSEGFSVGCWFKVPRAEPEVIRREGTITVPEGSV